MSFPLFLLFEYAQGSVSLFFFSSRRRHTRWPRDWSFRRVLFRSLNLQFGIAKIDEVAAPVGHPAGFDVGVAHFPGGAVNARFGNVARASGVEQKARLHAFGARQRGVGAHHNGEQHQKPQHDYERNARLALVYGQIFRQRVFHRRRILEGWRGCKRELPSRSMRVESTMTGTMRSGQDRPVTASSNSSVMPTASGSRAGSSHQSVQNGSPVSSSRSRNMNSPPRRFSSSTWPSVSVCKSPGS